MNKRGLISFFVLVFTVLGESELAVSDYCRTVLPAKIERNGDELKVLFKSDPISGKNGPFEYKLISINQTNGCYSISKKDEEGKIDADGGLAKGEQLELLLEDLSSSSKLYYYLPITTSSNINMTETEIKETSLNQLFTKTGPAGLVRTAKDKIMISVSMTTLTIPSITQISSANCSNPFSITSDNKIEHFNCIFTDTTTSDYFYNRMTMNFPMWTGIIIILTLNFMGMFAALDMRNPEHYKGSLLTLHPIYSLVRTAEEDSFSRRSRLTLIVVAISAYCFFNAIIDHFYIEVRGQEDLSLLLRLLVLPICGSVFASFPTYLASFFLLRYYRCSLNQANEILSSNKVEEKENIEKEYFGKLFRSIYLFYCVSVVLMIAFFSLSVFFMYKISVVNQAFWLLQVGLSVVWDWLVLDFVIVGLARAIPSLKRLFKRKGFYFDYEVYTKHMKVKGL